MTPNITNSNLYSSIINLVKLAAILLAARSNGMWQNMGSYMRQPIRPLMATCMGKAAPPLITVTAGAIIPTVVGYGARYMEEYHDFLGKNPHYNEDKFDLLKMAHYATHIGVISALLCGISYLSQPISSDVRSAMLFSSVYFYAVGRAYKMHPEESRLMVTLKYIPAICLGIVAMNRVSFIREHRSIITSSVSLGAWFHMMGFH